MKVSQSQPSAEGTAAFLTETPSLGGGCVHIFQPTRHEARDRYGAQTALYAAPWVCQFCGTVEHRIP
jgi:hypothetical protein